MVSRYDISYVAIRSWIDSVFKPQNEYMKMKKPLLWRPTIWQSQWKADMKNLFWGNTQRDTYSNFGLATDGKVVFCCFFSSHVFCHFFVSLILFVFVYLMPPLLVVVVHPGEWDSLTDQVKLCQVLDQFIYHLTR